VGVWSEQQEKERDDENMRQPEITKISTFR
jgi:hypothetical protein